MKKDRFVEVAVKDVCDLCYRRGKDNCGGCTRNTRKDKRDGYFVRVKSKPRPGKHERLLKALLECMTVNTCDGYVQSNNCSGLVMVSKNEAKQLLKIKEAMK